MMRVVALSLALGLTAGSAHALDCRTAVTTPEIAECAQREQKVVEARLNAVYQKVLKGFDRPDTPGENFSKMKRTLVEAQRAWVAFRKLDCDAVYAYYEAGTIRSIAWIGCMQQHAEQRIKALDETYGDK